MNRIALYLLLLLSVVACDKPMQPEPDSSTRTRDGNVAPGNPSNDEANENNYLIERPAYTRQLIDEKNEVYIIAGTYG